MSRIFKFFVLFVVHQHLLNFAESVSLSFGDRFKDFQYGSVEIVYPSGKREIIHLDELVDLTPNCATYKRKNLATQFIKVQHIIPGVLTGMDNALLENEAKFLTNQKVINAPKMYRFQQNYGFFKDANMTNGIQTIPVQVMFTSAFNPHHLFSQAKRDMRKNGSYKVPFYERRNIYKNIKLFLEYVNYLHTEVFVLHNNLLLDDVVFEDDYIMFTNLFYVTPISSTQIKKYNIHIYYDGNVLNHPISSNKVAWTTNILKGVIPRTPQSEFEMAVYMLPTYFDCPIPIDFDLKIVDSFENLDTYMSGYQLHQERREQYDKDDYKLCKDRMNYIGGHMLDIWNPEYGDKIYEAMRKAVAYDILEAIHVFADDEVGGPINTFTEWNFPFEYKFKEYQYGHIQYIDDHKSVKHEVLLGITNLMPYCATFKLHPADKFVKIQPSRKGLDVQFGRDNGLKTEAEFLNKLRVEENAGTSYRFPKNLGYYEEALLFRDRNDKSPVKIEIMFTNAYDPMHTFNERVEQMNATISYKQNPFYEPKTVYKNLQLFLGYVRYLHTKVKVLHNDLSMNNILFEDNYIMFLNFFFVTNVSSRNRTRYNIKHMSEGLEVTYPIGTVKAAWANDVFRGERARTTQSEFEMAVYLLPTYFNCPIPIDYDGLITNSFLDPINYVAGYNIHKTRHDLCDKDDFKMCKHIMNDRTDHVKDIWKSEYGEKIFSNALMRVREGATTKAIKAFD